MLKGKELNIRVEELVRGIHQQEGNQHLLYKELITLTSADELGTQYTDSDFNLYFPQNSLTVEEQVQIINRGYYKEFSNLVSFSNLPLNKEVDTEKLLQGIKRFTDCKLIPWIEISLKQQEEEFTGFYGLLLNTFIKLNKKYLGNDQQLGDLLDRTSGLINELAILTRMY